VAPIWLQAIVLGSIQGICEFLPISSSAHLVLIPELTGWKYLGRSFDVALHFGTLVAIVVYFREDVERLAQKSSRKLLSQIIVASLPAALIGLTLQDWFELHLNSVFSIAVFLATFGLLLGVAETWGRKNLELHNLTMTGAWLLGLAQSLALVPGVSRSGATITAALLLGLNRADSARISFLLALPVTAGACFLKLIQAGPWEFSWPVVLGILASGLSGWITIRALMGYVKRHSLRAFVVYRLILAALLLIWVGSTRL